MRIETTAGGLSELWEEGKRQASVGFSDDRTPIKHNLLFRWAGMDVGSAPRVAARWALHSPPCLYAGHLIVDLTAGDAVSDGRNEWWRASSPAIFSKLAAQNKYLRVHLYEKDKAAFQALITNLADRLRTIGFRQADETLWEHVDTNSTVSAFYGDARDLEQFELRPYEWLFVNDDPNNMHGLVLDLPRLKRVMAIPQGGGPRFVTFMTTMGCNAGGLKMLQAHHREWWFKHIEQAVAIVREHTRLDLALFEILNDSAQWAYLLLVPRSWSKAEKKDKIVSFAKEFAKEGLNANVFTWSETQGEFVEAINRLFFTKKERANGRVWKV